MVRLSQLSDTEIDNRALEFVTKTNAQTEPNNYRVTKKIRDNKNCNVYENPNSDSGVIGKFNQFHQDIITPIETNGDWIKITSTYYQPTSSLIADDQHEGWMQVRKDGVDYLEKVNLYNGKWRTDIK